MIKDNDYDNLEEYLPGISPSLLAQFSEFYHLVEKYNAKINLLSKGSVSHMASKHFADSMLGLEIFKDQLDSEIPIFDFGSGNGFPGLVVAMALSQHTVVIVERDQRKSEFIKIAADHLKVSNIKFHEGAVAELADGVCQTVISRAMAPLPKFLLESRRVVPPGGKVFLYKGEAWTSELGACPPQIFDHWEVDALGDYELPADQGPRFILQCHRLE